MPLEPSDAGNPQARLHQISCTTCRQRKVKCDKLQRCSNCVKAEIECVYAIPARPKRRIGNGKAPEDVSREELIHRVRRYEALFRKHGVKFDVPNQERNVENSSTSENVTATNDALLHDQGSIQPKGDVRPDLAPQSNLWIEDLSGEILEDFYDRDSPAVSVPDTPWATSDHLTMSFSSESNLESLTSFHPSTKEIYRLWEKFLDNVNPLVKVIHVPTVQRQLLEASVDLENVSRPFEALMFSIYACAIYSMSNEECLELTSYPRLHLQQRYCKIAHQALLRAEIFGTRNIVVLQAAVMLYLIVSITPQCDPGEVYVLIGIALRVGERIGLHRKAYLSDLSVIEIQTRRRLWWQIVRLDSHCAQKCRVDVLANPEHWQSTLPLNVNDSDLTLDMLVEPKGHVGSTEMTFRLMMYDIGKFIRHSTAMAPFGGSWQKLSSLSIPISDKDHVIDELEEMIESKYLRYCDPVIPLHILARSVAKILVNRMRLTTRHPRRFPDRGASMPEEEKQKIFEICLTMIEQDNLLHSMDCIRGFLWFIESEFQVDAFVYLLSELRRRDSEPITEKAWSEISKAFEYHPNLASDKNPLNMAICNLTLKSWESWENRAWQKQNSQIPRPDFIRQLLEQRKLCITTASEYSAENATMDLDVSASDPPIPYMTSAPANWDFDLTSISDPIFPIDWNYWNDLIQNSENYVADNLAPQTEWTA